ncbi:uncharacterized protein LOC125265431 [Megalobrama amblycephala]|uniref:uncharacterized protein LOC125265431 n=1 Tax=Megalobrama amblycephala TaxID=75352 RepID=UPI0020140F18|nr:uncharacterized protein LOC125265431 [Megalobrama amblycephala]
MTAPTPDSLGSLPGEDEKNTKDANNQTEHNTKAFKELNESKQSKHAKNSVLNNNDSCYPVKNEVSEKTFHMQPISDPFTSPDQTPKTEDIKQLVEVKNDSKAVGHASDSLQTKQTNMAGVGTSSSGTPGTSDTQARNTQPASSEGEGTHRTTSSTQGTSERQTTETRDTQPEGSEGATSSIPGPSETQTTETRDTQPEANEEKTRMAHNMISDTREEHKVSAYTFC